MAKTRQQKQDLVSTLSDKFARAKSVVFTDYKGLTMAQLSQLRNKLKETHAEFTITKNSLLDLALTKSDIRYQKSDIRTGPTATLFAYDDEITPIKTLVKTLKEAAIGSVKAGFLGSEFLDAPSITALANLPSKTDLKGMLVGVLFAPIQGIAGVMKANLRNLVYALEQIRIQKEGGGEQYG